MRYVPEEAAFITVRHMALGSTPWDNMRALEHICKALAGGVAIEIDGFKSRLARTKQRC
jgi:hypothetical protein